MPIEIPDFVRKIMGSDKMRGIDNQFAEWEKKRDEERDKLAGGRQPEDKTRSNLALKFLANAENWDPTTQNKNNMFKVAKKYGGLYAGQPQSGLTGTSDLTNPDLYTAAFAGEAANVYNQGEAEKQRRVQQALGNYLAQYGDEQRMTEEQRQFYLRLKNDLLERERARQDKKEEEEFGLGDLIGPAVTIAASDRRFKKNIRRIGQLPSGLPVYTYSYKWEDVQRVGVMGDEAIESFPDAVIENGGYLYVDYSKIR